VRVLHVAEAFGGGLLQMVVAVAEGSAARGHDALIAYGVRPETPERPRDVVDEAVELRALPWTRRTPGAQVRAARALRELVAEWRPDVIHLHSSFAGAVGAFVCDGSVPTVFSPNAFASAVPEAGPLRRAVYRAAERAICRRVTLVGAVSESEAELARELGAARVVRVPNGIPELDPGRLAVRPAHAAPATGRPLIVATGRTVPQRRPESTARILAAARAFADVAWLGGGGGSRGEAGRRALEAAGIPLSGWLPREELLDRLASATAYLHWTAWDGLPLSILEALALDVVVVASDIPPNREILGPSGVRRTEEEAVELLRRVVTDPAFREELRAEQRERRGEFSAELMVERWHRLYEELAGAGARPALASSARAASSPSRTL